MYSFLTASKDATIYLQQPNQNTGLDEILEISKIYYGSVKDISRALIKFDISYISQSLINQTARLEEVSLIMKETQSEEIPLDYTLYAYPISGSWEMGIGTRFDEISTMGVTWRNREGDSKLKWLVDTTNDGITTNFAAGSTGSYSGYGGVWYTGYTSEQNYSYNTADIHMDVKSMCEAWLSGSIPNDGIIMKFSDDTETDNNDYGIVRLFGKETHTIYQPKIRVGWDDQTFITQSLQPITSNEIKVGVTNLSKEYKVNSKPIIKVFGRELFPLKTFSTQFAYKVIKYLPQTTYYQIKDADTEDVIIPFSEFSKVSCNGDGNFIQLDLTNWETDRVYSIEIKVDNNGNIQYFDDDLTFIVAK